jgi:ketosteroid isomerase-like protein
MVSQRAPPTWMDAWSRAAYRRPTMAERSTRRWTDELELRDLVVRFSDAVTRGDWDRFEAVFAPDAVWEESEPFPNRYVGSTAIRSSVAASTAHVDVYVQMPHGTVVTRLDGDHASATTSIQGVSVVGDLVVVNFGVYDDDFVRTAAGWRFAHRWLQNVYVELGPRHGQVVTGRADLSDSPR